MTHLICDDTYKTTQVGFSTLQQATTTYKQTRKALALTLEPVEILMLDDMIRFIMICSVNEKRRQVFDIIFASHFHKNFFLEKLQVFCKFLNKTLNILAIIFFNFYFEKLKNINK